MIVIVDSKAKYYKYQTQLTENLTIDQNGYLICEGAILGRSGTQTYLPRELGLDGKEPIDVYRLEEEVFSDESMHSLEGRPFTINHPKVLVTQENHSKYAKGFVYNVRREGNNLVGDIQISDPKAIELVLDKKMRDLSLGYTMDIVYDEEKGIYYFKNIVYNHIALVKVGRAGNAHISDSLEEIILDEREKEMEITKEELQAMFSETLKGFQTEMKQEIESLKTESNQRFEKLEATRVEPQPTEPTVEPQPQAQPNEEVLKMLSELKAQMETLKVEKQPTQVEPQPQVQVEPQVANFGNVGEVEPKPQDKDLEMNNMFHSFAKKPNETEQEYIDRLRDLTINEKLSTVFEKEQYEKQK